jgi:phage-related protein
MNNAEVLVKFTGETKDLETKTNKAGSVLKGFASGVGVAFKTAGAAIATAGLAIGSLVKQSVDAYAEFEQLEGGLEALFGKGSKEMNDILATSEQAWQDLTMSQNQYLNAFEGSYALVKNGMADETKAIEYTNKVLQLSSDLFNTYGKSTEYYQNAIDWALKGTYSYLDNLTIGIKGTEEGFLEAANASGVLGREIKSVKELTNEEIVDVIQHYAEAAGAWGKTQTEASTTILGSLNMVKATWSNFVSGLSKTGADLEKLIDNLVGAFTTFAGNVIPVVVRAIQGIAKALPKLAKEIGKVLPNLVKDVLPPLLEAALELIKTIGEVLPDLITTLVPAVVDAALMLIEALVNALPTIIPALMDGIIKAVIGLVKLLPQIIDALIQGVILIIQALAEALPDLLPAIIEAILQIIPLLIKNIPLLIKCGMELIWGLIKGIGQAIGLLWDKIKEIGSKVIEHFKELPGKLIDIGKNMIKGLWNGIKNVTGWIIDKIKGFGSSVMKAIKGIFGVHSPSTEFEWVGRMNMLGLEQGMESMKDKVQNTIDGLFNLQPGITGTMNSTYSPQTNVIVQNNMEIDPLGQVVNQIKTFSGGAKNDYNWGATQ